MMINRWSPLRYLKIRTCTTQEGRHRRWREDRRQLKEHSDLAAELIRSYCSHMRNSNCITGINTVKGVVTVAARSLLMEGASLMGHLVDGTWHLINSRGIVTMGREGDSQIIRPLLWRHKRIIWCLWGMRHRTAGNRSHSHSRLIRVHECYLR